MFKYKKRFGQNFLVDTNVKNKILKFFDLNKKDIVFEIGAGNGSLSEKIAIQAKKMFLIEIDKILFDSLIIKFKKFHNVVIFNDDFLKFDITFFKKKKVRIFGNIPYKISSRIFIILLKIVKNIKDIHFVVQKEFADKINNKSRSYLFFFINYNFNFVRLFDIKSTSFFPSPKVESSFIKFVPKKKMFLLNIGYSKKVLKTLFKNKKKKINVILPEIFLFKKYINIYIRPGELSLSECIRLLNLIYSVYKKNINKDI